MNTTVKSLIVALISLNLFGAEILKLDPHQETIWVSTNSKEIYKLKDQVCVYHSKGTMACGDIIAQTMDRFAIKTYEVRGKFQTKDLVSIRKTKRVLASTAQLTDKFNDGKNRDLVDISLGFNAGLNYYYPSMQFQLAVSRNFSLGISPAFAKYSQDGDEIQLLGGYITATYYYTHFAFKGVNFEGGLGMFNVKATSGNISQDMNPLAAKLTGGWRGRALIGLPIDFGGNLGLQYIFSQSAPLDTSFKGILPLLNVFVAYCF